MLFVIIGISLLSGAAGYALARLSISPAQPASLESVKADSDAGEHDPNAVTLGAEQQKTAGIRIEAISTQNLTEWVWRTGRIDVNQDRVAHISPPVEGIVREVNVQLGQAVQAGDDLAILDSREVGQAKLDLVKARMNLASAKTQTDWTRTTGQNTEDLVTTLATGLSQAEVELKFKNRPLGEWRQQLMTSYSRRNQARAQLEAITPVTGGVIAESTVRRVRAEAEANEAAYQAISEELKFQARQQIRAANQKLLEAQANEDISTSQLLMMGFKRDEIAQQDPIAEGQQVSRVRIRAPFAGTILEKHAVRSERVGPTLQMFELVDLSTVWVQADVFETDLPLVQQIKSRQLAFRNPSAGIPERKATVFYAGDRIDPKSRTLTILASVENADRSLKPGLFVEVGLPKAVRPGTLQLPASAIQRHENQTFVFVQEDEERFRRVNVTLGVLSGDIVEIIAGLKSGQKVAVEGGFTLKSELLKDLIAGE